MQARFVLLLMVVWILLLSLVLMMKVVSVFFVLMLLLRKGDTDAYLITDTCTDANVVDGTYDVAFANSNASYTDVYTDAFLC